MSARIHVARSFDSTETRAWAGRRGDNVVHSTPGASVRLDYKPGEGALALRKLEQLVELVRLDVAEAP